MLKYRCLFLICAAFVATIALAGPQEAKAVQGNDSASKARVFITDSQSWEVQGSAGGSNGAFAAHSHGGARPQTAEIVKTFGERCPDVIVNNKQELADYIVVLDHEGGKGILRHRNKIAVFEHVSGDVIVSHSTLSLGNSVKDACAAIAEHWTVHNVSLRSAKEKSKVADGGVVTKSSDATKGTSAAHVTIASVPDNADIEIDGSFVGNTPSVLEINGGEHEIVVKKNGYTAWTRKLKVTGGDIKLNAELEKR